MANPTIEEIFEKTDIVALVGEYVQLTKKGKNYSGLCPFHQEKTPSFTVSVEKKLAHCFSCHKGGNPAQFLMDLKHITFKEALEILAKKAGLEYHSTNTTENTKNYAKYYEITNLAKEFYKRNLLKTESGQIAIEYLHKRGIDDQTIKMFDIGLAPAKIDSLYQTLKEANFLDIDMKAIGLIRSNVASNYDMFIKRVMFPIKDVNGNVVGFSGRIYYEDKEQPKYINSPESLIFNKSEVLYNLDKAQLAITKANRVILHEGFMDVFASVKAGFNEAVCSMGTALTVNHVRILKKFTNNIVLCYDGDKAGLTASKRAINLLEQNGMQIHIVMLPDSLDPDEYVRKYGELAYQKYFTENQLDAVEFLFRYAIKFHNLNDFNEVVAMKNEIFEVLLKANSESTAEVYLGKLASSLNVSIEAVKADYRKYCNTARTQKYVEYIPDDKKTKENHLEVNNYPKSDGIKALMLEYCFKDIKYAKYVDAKIDEYDLMQFLGNDFANVWYQLIDGYYNRYDIFTNEKFEEYIMENKDAMNSYLHFKNIYYGNKNKDNQEFCDNDFNELIIKIIRLNYAFKLRECKNENEQIGEAHIDNVQKMVDILTSSNRFERACKQLINVNLGK